MPVGPRTAKPLRIAVLAGGDSDERDVSLSSGDCVAKALAGRGHFVTRIDPADAPLATLDWSDFDVAYLALHGKFGEDGHVQGILEEIGIPYTGSDADASRLAFSKSASKERFLQFEVPTPPYVLIHESDDPSRIEKQARKIGYPLVVKPDAQGSSIGVTIVESPAELSDALATCFAFDKFGLIEACVVGTEWTLGLIDEQPLPLIQIETGREFFDFHAKYEDDATRYQFEFGLETNIIRAIENAGVRAAQSLGTSGIARVDIRVDRQNRPWVLEVNTIPGFTDHSLVPKAAARLGWSLGELCERAIQGCLPKETAIRSGRRTLRTPNSRTQNTQTSR
jgi:D-alanine-D-alanine ligase